MRAVLLVMFVAAVCGCGGPPAATPTESSRDVNLFDAKDIQLPIAIGAKAHNLSEEDVIFLNVNQEGQVALPPPHARPDGRNLLSTQAEVLAYLQKCVKEERKVAGPLMEGKPPRFVILLRIDARTRFEKLNTILTAAQQVGYVKYRLRVVQPEFEVEGEFDLGWPTQKEVEPPLRYTIRLTADDSGKTERITFHGDTPIARLDHGTDLVALLETLTVTSAAAERDRRNTILAIEVDPRLAHAHLVQVIDISSRAGYRAVRLFSLAQEPS